MSAFELFIDRGNQTALGTLAGAIPIYLANEPHQAAWLAMLLSSFLVAVTGVLSLALYVSKRRREKA